MPNNPDSNGLKTFKLTRYFSGASLLGIVLVTTCLIWLYQDLTVRNVIKHEDRANTNLTNVFANSVWLRYRDFVTNDAPRSREELLSDPLLPRLRSDVLAKTRGLPVVKMKIYNLDGLTVFSTAESQIGEDKSENREFQIARDGVASSQITFRKSVESINGTRNNRQLISSYVPIRSRPDAEPEGVLEVYSDVTELLEEQNQALWQIAVIVLGLLSTLYFFLFFVVRKADFIIAKQERFRAAKEEEIRHIAYHDALTGLPNRARFNLQLEDSITSTIQANDTGALLFIDLDRFKIVNDSLGHHAGDLLLQEMSARISAQLNKTDKLFRVGGDEFTVILPNIDNISDIELLLSNILDTVSDPVMIHENEIIAGATIGVAIYPQDGKTANSLLKNADAAMYSAKQAGRGTYAFYKVEMNRRADKRLDLEASLRQGIRNEEFQLYYQPRIDSLSNEVVGMEALLRWDSPTLGMQVPNEFISVLEDTGMITVAGEWVMRTACEQVNSWIEQGIDPLRVSINVSSIQFQSNGFVQMVQRTLEETGVPPYLIELELTESLLIYNVEQAQETIKLLKRLGISIAIDDFGTGYSSLNYLRQFDVDYLKIDRSFVTEISTDTRARSVALAIINLANELDMIVVAEGIETADQAAFFAEAGCGELQGYLYSKPLPIGQIQPFLINSGHSRAA